MTSKNHPLLSPTMSLIQCKKNMGSIPTGVHGWTGILHWLQL